VSVWVRWCASSAEPACVIEPGLCLFPSNFGEFRQIPRVSVRWAVRVLATNPARVLHNLGCAYFRRISANFVFRCPSAGLSECSRQILLVCYRTSVVPISVEFRRISDLFDFNTRCGFLGAQHVAKRTWHRVPTPRCQTVLRGRRACSRACSMTRTAIWK